MRANLTQLELILNHIWPKIEFIEKVRINFLSKLDLVQTDFDPCGHKLNEIQPPKRSTKWGLITKIGVEWNKFSANKLYRLNYDKIIQDAVLVGKGRHVRRSGAECIYLPRWPKRASKKRKPHKLIISGRILLRYLGPTTAHTFVENSRSKQTNKKQKSMWIKIG